MSISPKISIAISGGGISGLTLARGLSKFPHLSITIYEATSKFLDIGGGIALHGNGLSALANIDHALQQTYFDKATLMTERDIEMSTMVIVADAKDADGNEREEILAEIGRAKGRKTVARHDLLDGLLSLVPEGTVKFGKRLFSVSEISTGGVEMTFKDCTMATADCLIGCDGVKSITRRYLLGQGHPALEPKNHDGWNWIRRNVPAEEVLALNPKLLDFVPIYCGKGGMMNSMPLHFGKTISLAVIQAPSTGSKMQDSVDSSTESGVQENADPVVAETFRTWSKDARDVAELCLRDPITDWKLADHDPAPFYCKNNVLMIGDAAHATMPFAGQGAAQAIEDGAVLTALFEHVKTKEQIVHAFKAFDEVRRPRSQKVVEMSRRYGRSYAFCEEGIGSDLNKIRMAMGEGEMYTSGIDLDAQNQQAVDRFLEAVRC